MENIKIKYHRLVLRRSITMLLKLDFNCKKLVILQHLIKAHIIKTILLSLELHFKKVHLWSLALSM